MDTIRLWLHEASRVYADKLIEDKDMENFKKMKFDIAKAGFEVGKESRLKGRFHCGQGHYYFRYYRILMKRH